jgi:hypothetical protein
LQGTLWFAEIMRLLIPEASVRKLLLVLAGSMLLAVPARAQQVVEPAARLREAVAPAPTLDAAVPAAPTLDPSRDEIRARVAENESARAAERSGFAGQGDYIYLVAAIVVGIVIAALVLN